MKSLKIFVLALLGVVSAITFSKAQDYKHPYGLVNQEGKVLDNKGKHIGWVTNEGVIKDINGVKISHVDSEVAWWMLKRVKKLER